MTSPREFFCQIPASLVRDGAGENPAAVRRFRHLVRAGFAAAQEGAPARHLVRGSVASVNALAQYAKKTEIPRAAPPHQL